MASNRILAGVAITVVLATSAWVAGADEDTEPPPTSATTVTASTPVTPTSVASSTTLATRRLSPAWVEFQMHATRVVDLSFDAVGIVEANLAADYTVSNPNVWTTPMGALCWADFELTRTAEMANYRELLDDDLIPFVVEQLGIEDQVSSDPGPATSRAVIAILDSYTTTTTTAGGVPNPGAEFASSEVINILRVLDRWAGTGTEYLDALDRVASPGWAAAVRAGDGLPADVLQYADGLAANALEQLSIGQPEISGYFFGTYVDGYWEFVELAKYDPNCLRAMIGDPPPPLPDIPDLTTTVVGATTTTLRSGSVRVRGADLNGLLIRGEAGLGVGYSRPAGVGSFDDTTFTMTVWAMRWSVCCGGLTGRSASMCIRTGWMLRWATTRGW